MSKNKKVWKRCAPKTFSVPIEVQVQIETHEYNTGETGSSLVTRLLEAYFLGRAHAQASDDDMHGD